VFSFKRDVFSFRIDVFSLRIEVLVSSFSAICTRIGIPLPHCSIWNDCMTRSIGGTVLLYSSKDIFSTIASSGLNSVT